VAADTAWHDVIGQLPRTALIGLAVLVWATLTAAWLVPPMLDWNRYRADISSLVSRELGQDLVISGQVHLVLLPQPLLVVDDVELTDSGDNFALSARELRLRVAFWPLLAGRVETQELVLSGFTLQSGWPLGRLGGRLQPPAWLASFSARIEDGEVRLGSMAFSHLNATVRLLPDTGGMALSGRTEWVGLPWSLAAHLTRAGADGAAGLDAAFDGQDKASGVNVNFSGQLAADGQINGHVNAHGPDLAALLAAPAGPFKLDAQLAVHDTAIAASDMSAELGGSSLHGSADLVANAESRLVATLSASSLNLDAWLPMLLRNQKDSWPPHLTTHLLLSSEAGTLLGGQVRQLRADLDLSGEQAVLHDFKATLPGAAQLAISGRLQRGGTEANFQGNAALAAPALRDTLAWLAKAGLLDPNKLPDSLLHSADLRAAITVQAGAPPSITLSDLNGMIDASHIQGSLTVHPGARLGIAATLEIDRFGLGDLIPGNLALAGLPARAGLADLDLHLHILQADIGGTMLSPVMLDASIDASRLDVHRFEAQLPGARLALSGAVAADGQVTDGRLDLVATADAMRDLGKRLPTALASHLPAAALTTTILADGKPEALSLRSTLDLGDLHAKAAPLVNLSDGSWHGTWALRHSGASRLLADTGLTDTRGWLGEGSFSASGTLAGSGPPWALKMLQLDGFDLAIGQLRANGVLHVDFSPTPKLTGHLNADVLPLPLPGLRSTAPLNLSALSIWQADMQVTAHEVLGDLTPILRQASVHATLANGVLTLADLTARLADGAFSGHASIDSTASPPMAAADFTLAGAHPAEQLFDLPLDIVGGTVDGSTSLHASGFAPATLLATLEGTLNLSWRDGTLNGIDLARMAPRLDESELRQAVNTGSTAFTEANVAADIQNGGLHFTSASFSGAAGKVDMSGLIDLVGRTEELRLTLGPAVAMPPNLSLRLSGPVETPTRIPDLSDAARWRALYAPLPPVPAAASASPSPAASPATKTPNGNTGVTSPKPVIKPVPPPKPKASAPSTATQPPKL